MQAEFRDIHAELEAAMDVLDGLTKEALPNPTAVAAGRARLSRAVGKRRALFDRATNHLGKTATPADAQTIRQLRDLNATQLEASTAHIGTWGLKQLVENWPDYVRTAAPMRQSMRDLIAADRTILIPMLDRTP